MPSQPLIAAPHPQGQARAAPPFRQVSFSRQFLIACAAILAAGMATLGHWLGRQIETSAVERTAAIAAVYVESILATELRSWNGTGTVDRATHAKLDQLFIHGPLRRKVLRFKLWDAAGLIAYSSDSQQLGLRFAIDAELAAALRGKVQAKVSDLQDADNQREHMRWPRLLEVYVPLRLAGQDRVIGAAEFYHSTDNLGRDIVEAQRQAWMLVAVSTLVMYLLLIGLVRRADNLIVRQQHDLEQQLIHLGVMLQDNNRMRERLGTAGVRTTTLNEQFLRRVAADIHDGPAQTIALAKMRFDELTLAPATPASATDAQSQDIGTVQQALHTALQELRHIAAGLAIPGVTELSLGDTVYRAIRDFERSYGASADVNLGGELDRAPLAVKITLYRVLREALANSWRHAPSARPRVSVRVADGRVLAEISDDGPGFDPTAVGTFQLGLALMRERVRLLGGVFTLDSTPGRGTRICVDLPLASEELSHGN